MSFPARASPGTGSSACATSWAGSINTCWEKRWRSTERREPGNDPRPLDDLRLVWSRLLHVWQEAGALDFDPLRLRARRLPLVRRQRVLDRDRRAGLDDLAVPGRGLRNAAEHARGRPA